MGGGGVQPDIIYKTIFDNFHQVTLPIGVVQDDDKWHPVSLSQIPTPKPYIIESKNVIAKYFYNITECTVFFIKCKN